MTVTYTAAVATCTGLGCFWKLLFRWKGSIYKLLWPNLLLYSVVYTLLSLLYRFILDDQQRVYFEKISIHCQTYGDYIQIQFILGFYVGIVIKRWWDQYTIMPWPDRLAMFISTLVHGQDDRGRLIRRTLIRFINLSVVLVFRMMSPGIKKRFPTMEHLIEAGFLQPEEKKIFDNLDLKCKHPKYWMPLVWCGAIIVRARKEGRIRDDYSMKTLIDELNAFRAGCGGMLNYDWITIPLVYTQVVTLAVYIYFSATLMGSQELSPKSEEDNEERQNIDLVVPIFTLLQFFFYMGWLKVAESLVNPWGEDDDDFDLNWLVDRNLQVSYVIVDEMHQEHPEMMRDQYWDEIFPVELPYTAGTKQYQTGAPPNSTDLLEVAPKDAKFLPLDTVTEESRHSVRMRGYDNFDAQMSGGAVSLYNVSIVDDKYSAFRQETNPMKIQRKNSDTSETEPSSSTQATASGKKSITNLWKRVVNTSSGPHKNINSRSSSVSLQSRRRSTSINNSAVNVDPVPTSNLSREANNTNINKDDMIFQMSNTSTSFGLRQSLHEQQVEQVTEIHQLTHPHKQDLETDLKPVDLSLPDDDDDQSRSMYVAANAQESWGRLADKKEWLMGDQQFAENYDPYFDATAAATSHDVSHSPPVVQLFSQVPSESRRVHPCSTVSGTESLSSEDMDHVTIDISLSQLSTLSLLDFQPSETLIKILSKEDLLSDKRLDIADTAVTSFEIVVPTMCATPAATTTSIVTSSITSMMSSLTSMTQAIRGLLSSTAITDTPANETSPDVRLTVNESAANLQVGISTPFIPSAAIPVPSVSPAHASTSHVSDSELEMMEAAKAARRVFFDLEPISEQSETQLAKKTEYEDKIKSSQHSSNNKSVSKSEQDATAEPKAARSVLFDLEPTSEQSETQQAKKRENKDEAKSSDDSEKESD